MAGSDLVPQPNATERNAKERAALAKVAHGVKDRFGMVRFLKSSLQDEYLTAVGDGVRQTSTFAKAYVVEVDQNGSLDQLSLWKRFFSNVQTTDEDSLLRAFDKAGNPYFIDTRDKRFCLIHSIAKSEQTDRVISAIFESQDGACDRAWFTSQFLLNTHIGQMRGFKFTHQPLAQGIHRKFEELPQLESAVQLSEDHAWMDQADTNAQDTPEPEPTAILKSSETQSLPARATVAKVRRSALYVKDSASAKPDFDSIRKQNIFESRRSLEWIQYRAFTESGDDIVHTAFDNGKITASGVSVALHLMGVEAMVKSYAADIRRIEDEYSIGWVSSGNGSSLRGAPLTIRFSNNLEIVDLVEFSRSIFRSAKPFRLFGYPHSITDRRIDVEAIDLHTRGKFSVEISKTFMRIYLPIGGCGNMIARLLTNMQHAMDSEVGLIGEGGEALLTGSNHVSQ